MHVLLAEGYADRDYLATPISRRPSKRTLPSAHPNGRRRSPVSRPHRLSNSPASTARRNAATCASATASPASATVRRRCMGSWPAGDHRRLAIPRRRRAVRAERPTASSGFLHGEDASQPAGRTLDMSRLGAVLAGKNATSATGPPIRSCWCRTPTRGRRAGERPRPRRPAARGPVHPGTSNSSPTPPSSPTLSCRRPPSSNTTTSTRPGP